MPGNEVGDRVHNFFGQENLSQGQYHSQAVDGNWPGLGNNLWAGTQRPSSVPFFSNLKNYNQQQSDSEQGHSSYPHLRHGLNLSQSNLRPEPARNQLPNQKAVANGYMQGQQVFQTRQNEANILGVDTESDWHLSRGIPVLESQGSGLELYKKNLARNAAAESPVNFDFFGGQQQISGRHSGMLQPSPRQQSGLSEMHLLQQQAVLNQMQELQRQQQFHQLEAKQHNSMTPASSISKQAVASHSASLISGVPVNEASNLMWQPEVITTNVNWLQRGASPVLQGSSNGLVLSPEQGQALRLMSLVPNQGDQSLYGVPISGSRGAPNMYSHVQADKPAVPQASIPHQYAHVHGDKPALHISASDNLFTAHQYAAFSNQINTNDGTSVSSQDIQGKSMFGSTDHGLNSGLNIDNLQQVNPEQQIVPMQDFRGRQELAGSLGMSQDKMLLQAPSSQNVATLNPAEEKILFGSDDSLWDGFGKNTGGFNMLDGPDSFGGFPSVQSGSWSALMQSAVAETSGSDLGIQEEWSGLGFQNTGRSSGNERPSTTDSCKQQSVWTDSNWQSASASNINSRPFLRPDDVSRSNTIENYSGVSGFHQSGPDTLHEQYDRLQNDSQRSIPQSERGKWLDCSPQQKQLAEGGHIYGNAANSSGLEKNQQTILSCNSSGDPFNKSNGWNVMKLPPFDQSSTFKTHENENSLQPDYGKAMHEKMGQVPAMWEPDSDTNSSVGMERVKSVGHMQVFGEDSGTNGIAALPNSSTGWFNWQISNQRPKVDAWRDAESIGSYRRDEGPGKYKHHIEKNPLVLESSNNGKVEGETHDLENSNKTEKPGDALSFNPSHPRAVGMRENTSFDGNDLHSPKLSGQGNRRPLVTRKFQFHPMGDLGVEVDSYGDNHAKNSQPMPHQPFGGLKGQSQSYLGPSKYGHSDGNYVEMNKGESKSLDHMSKTLITVDRNVGNSASQKTASPRVPETESSDGSVVHPQQNQSPLSHSFGLQLAPPTQRLPVVSPHGLSETDCSTPRVSETMDKGHTWLATNQTISSGEPSHGEIRNNISSSTGQTFDKASQFSVLGNIPQAFTSGFPFCQIHTRNQNLADLGGQVANTQSANTTFTASMNPTDEYSQRVQTSQSELDSAQDMSQLSVVDQNRLGDPAIQISAAEAGTLPLMTFNASPRGIPSKVIHNVWTSVSSKQHPKASRFLSQPQQINDCEMTTGSQKSGDEGFEKDGNDLSGIGPCSAYSNSSVGNLHKESSMQLTLPENVVAADGAAGASHLKESAVKCMSDASQPSPAATSRDIEAFGRSLRPNMVLNHNFSLLEQVQSMRNVETDPNNRDIKRLKVSDNVVDIQLVDSNRGQRLSYGYDNAVKDGSSNNSMPSSDLNILSFTTKPHYGQEQDTSASSQELVGYGQKNALTVTDSNKATSVKSGHSLVNPQMAPSWFERYGTFKNGKMLPMYDLQKMTASKIVDQPFIVPNQSNSLRFHNSIEQVNSVNDSQLSNARQSQIPVAVASELADSQLSTPAVEPELLIMRPKKRKSATSELLPWHKELLQGSERLRDISAAELDWAQSVNRLIEKVEDNAEAVEDLSAVVKSKRRLVLTTQLMQQLISPPPAAVLVADVKLHHESVVYSVTRLALGEACSSISWSGSKSLLPEKCTASNKIDHYILKVMDFVGRARKLEDEILSLDSKSSVLDLRVECQDLERFSVINRFAKFHGRGQNDGAETSSSDANTNAQISLPLKYVTAVPLPRNLPDRVPSHLYIAKLYMQSIKV